MYIYIVFVYIIFMCNNVIWAHSFFCFHQCWELIFKTYSYFCVNFIISDVYIKTSTLLLLVMLPGVKKYHCLNLQKFFLTKFYCVQQRQVFWHVHLLICYASINVFAIQACRLKNHSTEDCLMEVLLILLYG